VISELVFTLKPFVWEMDAVTLLSAICVKLRPVTPLAGMLVILLPSPTKEPLMIPDTFKSPEKSEEPDTDSDPDMCASNIFI
jgi:hypothetical protein